MLASPYLLETSGPICVYYTYLCTKDYSAQEHVSNLPLLEVNRHRIKGNGSILFLVSGLVNIIWLSSYLFNALLNSFNATDHLFCVPRIGRAGNLTTVGIPDFGLTGVSSHTVLFYPISTQVCRGLGYCFNGVTQPIGLFCMVSACVGDIWLHLCLASLVTMSWCIAKPFSIHCFTCVTCHSLVTQAKINKHDPPQLHLPHCLDGSEGVGMIFHLCSCYSGFLLCKYLIFFLSTEGVIKACSHFHLKSWFI